MRKKTLVLSLLLACATAFGQSSYDLVIVGGNPGGIMAAISAARMGKKSVILERTRYVGGLPANGLGPPAPPSALDANPTVISENSTSGGHFNA